MGHQLQRLTHCLNCEQPSEGNFCSNCGQENEDQTASLKAVMEDFLDDIIHFDSRLVRTAIPLVFKPGFLTNEYNRGKRARYLSPYRMYLFVSAIFFLLLAYASTLPGNNIVTESPDRSTAATKQKAAADVAEAKAETTKALKEAGLNPNLVSVTGDKNKLNILVGPPDVSKFVPAVSKPGAADDDSDDEESGVGYSNASIMGRKIDLSHLPHTVQEYMAAQAALPSEKRDPSWMQNLKKNVILIKSDNSILLPKVLDLIPKMTFFLVPLYAASLYPMYLRRKRYYVEHLIYSLHTHAYVFVIFILLLILSLPGVRHLHAFHGWSDSAVALLLLSVPVYLFISMKQVYGQSVLKTFLKFSLAWSVYWVMLTVATVVVVLLVLFT